ncbi:aldehyde dehydrogenase family protein [Altererythrobacter sp. JGD-16]|uniref:Aldehyde dehydrogenase family protein n=2 Tax=Altererythrobacter lutimaris TaxID=2743979 RepID=A0A850H9M7_9SPHN|nr:aldehyde dehydrogenase family protein [Altererythrobacter lutimaris]NVE96034.1 aldehyde dehydrogenase family protein [Altererythrobacter lutimaris]
MDFDSDYRLTIGGALRAASKTFSVINPATGRAFAEAPDASRSDLDDAVAAARSAFAGWASTPHKERAELVTKLADQVEAEADPFSRLLTAEQGKPQSEAKREVLGLVAWLKAAASWDIPVHIHEDSEDRYCETRHVPIGVVGAIAPWNYPLLLAAFKLGPALTTGNCVVLKPSPFTPLSTLRLGELANSLLPSGVLNVLSGGDDLGPWLTSHPGIDKVAFTGSTATGKRVMASAAETLKRITLELGGNDPSIVMHDVDPVALAPKLFWASFGNSGQVCLASKRVYVHADIYSEVRDALVQFASGVKIGNGINEGMQLGPINNRVQYERIMRLIEESKAQDLNFALGGEVPECEGYFIPPIIIDNPPEDARIVCEEQFGPIVPLIWFEDYNDAIRRANASEYGLGATIWAGDENAGWALAQRIDAGNVWVNESRPLSPVVPFAGHKQSGFGVENGLEGLLEYTIPKTMSRRRSLSD